jgi:hypothetical protein
MQGAVLQRAFLFLTCDSFGDAEGMVTDFFEIMQHV